MMVSSKFNTRIEPSLGPAPKLAQEPVQTGDGTWWYCLSDGSHGPVSDEQLQSLIAQKVIDRSTQVWRSDFGQDWKRLDQTSLWEEPSSSSINTRSMKAESQTTFETTGVQIRTPVSAKSGSFGKGIVRNVLNRWSDASLLGLIFGPAYYIYLRMWRKAFVIIGLSIFCMIGASWLQGLFNSNLTQCIFIVMQLFCCKSVKSDYRRLEEVSETIWPEVIFLGNTKGLVALFVAIFSLGLIRENSGSNGPFTLGTWQADEEGRCDPTESFDRYTREEQITCTSKDYCLEPTKTNFTLRPDGSFSQDVMMSGQLVFKAIYRKIDDRTVLYVGIEGLNRSLLGNNGGRYDLQQNMVNKLSSMHRFHKCDF